MVCCCVILTSGEVGTVGCRLRDDVYGLRNHDPTAEGNHFGYGSKMVTVANKGPVAAAFTDAKQVDEDTAVRVIRDAIAVEKPLWMIRNSTFEILN